MPIQIHELNETLFEAIIKDELGVVVDLTGATLIEFRFNPPGPTNGFTRTGTVTDAVNGVMEYQATDTDLTPWGKWERQAHVTLASGKSYSSEIIEFTVHKNITIL